VGWSYTTYLTYIGVAIFVTMDLADIVLAFAKCLNYIKYQRSSEVVFGIMLCTWTYFRHYLNLKILWSVWTQYDVYVPATARYFRPQDRVWLAPWMKYQVFVPIMLLQFVNLFWYYLIWRIVVRIIIGQDLKDIRSSDEESEAQPAAKKRR